jgi:CRP/FNR family cyclic AMP-dependent transcriptional regulator
MPSEPNIALETIRALADGRELETHGAGEIIFHAGDPGDGLYAILEGQVVIEWGQGIYEELGPGDCFGFDVMIDISRRRYCNARAATAVTLLGMNREHFLLAIQEFPMFALESLQLMDQRLRRLKTTEPKSSPGQ